MKLKNILLMSTLLFGSTLFAQTEVAPTADGNDQVEAMIQELGLNEKQANQYRELVEKNSTEMAEMRKLDARGMDSERSKELHDKYEADLQSIMTTEQWETYLNKKKAADEKSIKRAEYLKEKQAEGRIKHSINE
jgi:hypothetical protein